MINGKIYDFESIKVALPSGFLTMFSSIKYDDKKEAKVHVGVGGVITGYSSGAYEGNCEAEMEREEYDRAFGASSKSGFYNMKPLTVTVSYGDEGNATVTDILEVKFDERSFEGKEGDEKLNVTVKGKLTKPIITNGSPAYVPV